MKARKNHVDPATSSGTSPTLRSRNALRVVDAATYFGCAPWFIEELIRDGEIPFRKLGKFRVFDADDLESWLARQPKVRVVRIEDGKAITERAA